MSALFKEFKLELRKVRKSIEAQDQFSLSYVVSSLDESDFYQKVILYRILEHQASEAFTKESLLRFLSLWEIEL